MFREIKTNIAIYSAHRLSDVKAEHSDQYIQSEQRKYHQERTRTEAWEKTSSESQLVSVLHLIG